MVTERRSKQFENTLANDTLIIREVLDAQTCLGNIQCDRLECIRQRVDEDMARAIASKMINNSAIAHERILGRGRPLSAFYTLYGDRVVIESGAIQPSGEAKLHDYLRKKIDYQARYQLGATVRSGHIGTVIGLEHGRITRIALFDCLSNDESIAVPTPEFKMVATMLNYNIVPITADGYPVRVI